MRQAAAFLIVALAAVALSGLSACSGNAESSEAVPETTPETSLEALRDEEPAEAVDDTPIDADLLASLIGEDDAAKLVEEAETNKDRRWIAAHPEAIDFEGDVVQAKLLKLAADEDEAVSFVRQFADRYPADAAEGDTGSAYDGDTRVPHLYQWDQRWGYTIYSSTAFGLTGCGPAAFAMVYQGVTGNSNLSPYDMGLLAQEMGHMAQFEGTDTAFFFDASAQLGLSCESVSIDADALQQSLSQGKVLIANMANGYFSHFSGHYIVLTELDSSGKLVINDPYSAVNSAQTWDVDFILGQTKGLYAFS